MKLYHFCPCIYLPEQKRFKKRKLLSDSLAERMKSRRPTTLKLGPKFTFPPFSWSFPDYNMTTHIHIARPYWQFLSRGVEGMIFKDEPSVQLVTLRLGYTAQIEGPP